MYNRIVVKVGTSTILYKNGMLNIRAMRRLTRILSDIKNSGKEIILVTSGAIGLGVGLLNLKERPKDMPTLQVCASVGQSELMSIYDDMFGKYGVKVGQVLLMGKENDEDVKNTFNKSLEFGIVPVVNANDAGTIEEINYSDNDRLSAVVARFVNADLLIIFSDVDGLYDGSPDNIIPLVTEITPHIEEIAGGAGSENATGGMKTKIIAAKNVMSAGIDMLIMNGAEPDRLYDLFEGKKVKSTLFSTNFKS